MLEVLVAVLLLTLVPGLWRVLRGPTLADRLMAIQLFATAGTAVLLMLAELQSRPALLDVALVLALLAAVVTAALVQLLHRGSHD
ncbi:MAG TPA: monovalent cation/H+ antiporter complex subunit F [Marinobacter sp.]|nr:monovalent cation/H+ antiporter complex subunit F [Marinobacter sp.]